MNIVLKETNPKMKNKKKLKKSIHLALGRQTDFFTLLLCELFCFFQC